MTIEIDDSGTGEIVGSAFIGLRKVETNDMIFKEIPLKLFGEKEWDLRKPQIKVIELVKDGLKELDYMVEEKIQICRSHFFKYLKMYLKEKKLDWEEVTIADPLQKYVEHRYMVHLMSIGVDVKSAYTLNPIKRNKALQNWVCRDFDNRVQFVKIGFKKGFKKLKEHCLKQITFLDPISEIHNFCSREGFILPRCYLLEETGEFYKLGVSFRPFKKENPLHYSSKFEDELQCKSAITGTGSALGKQLAKIFAYATICDKLNLEYL